MNVGAAATLTSRSVDTRNYTNVDVQTYQNIVNAKGMGGVQFNNMDDDDGSGSDISM